ncbi:MAG: SLBB domain-containing protein [Steroidobacteraceae bacterium]
MRRIARFLATLALLAAPAWAAAQTSAADAAAVFGNLTPEQQQAVLQQMGGQGGSAASGAARGASADRTRMPRTGTGDAGAGGNEGGARARGIAGAVLESGPPLLRPGDTVLVEISVQRQPMQAPAAGSVAASQPQPLPPELTLNTEERRNADKIMAAVRERNPYVLDRDGALQLPGFDPIGLAGLTDEQAGERVAADRAMVKLQAKITRLPLDKAGLAALKPFGYDLFDNAPSTFAPVTDVPVPADYVVGPGDVLQVQLYGNQNRTFSLTVSRDGRVNFPQLGPISVGGRHFSQVRGDIESRVARQMIGVSASLSMGDLRSIQVFVLGEVRVPGAYAVSGLATMTTALFASGGVKPIGSLRNIQLKRQGELVRRLDLYDLLLKGDTANDAKLLPGDVIFIPPVGPTVSVYGEVQRPAVYELKGAESVAGVIAMAGGLTTEADASRGALTRVDEQRRRVVLDVDLAATAGAGAGVLRNGDVLRIARLRPTLDSGVVLQGHVFRPGSFAWREGLRLSQVIPSVDELKPDADQHYVLIRRELPPDRRIAVLSADLAAALRAPGSAADVELQPRDELTVFDLSTDRERIIAPLMNELAVQGGFDRPTEHVSISGRVKVPGDYPLEPHMHVADLVRAGGTLDAAAYGGTAELSRYVVENGQVRRTQVLPIDLSAALRGDADANVELQAFDGLYIKEISGWSKQEQVELRGEVRFPGAYPIRKGETLRSVIERAGGLTDQAFADGSVFTREDLRVREQEQLDRLTDRLRADLASMSLMAARANQGGGQQTYAAGQSVIEQLRSAKAIGRLVIDLNGVLAAPAGSAADVVLRNNDLLMIPKRSQEVTVMGEVQNTTSHLYVPGLSRNQYIDLSGGFTRGADKGRVYVVRANGSVVADATRWLGRSGAGIHPGDTIVVPMNTDRLPTLTLWQSATQILYNVAIAAAAVHSF